MVKRKYVAGSQKRKEKKRKIKASTENTSQITTFFKARATTSCSDSDDEEPAIEPTMAVLESDNTAVAYQETIPESVADAVALFDLTNEYPTDRGYYPSEINDRNLKQMILDYGPCRPKGPFEVKDQQGHITVNFSASYYTKYEHHTSCPRLWLCYSNIFEKPYCETCWLFADRNNRLYHLQKAWIDGVDSTKKRLPGKITNHENSALHIEASNLYYRWKEGKIIDADLEMQVRQECNIWSKVIRRVLSIILCCAKQNLALRGHAEQVGDGVAKGGNFLALVALMAEYDEVISEITSLPKNATKFMSPTIQNELIINTAIVLRQSLVGDINESPFWSIILDTTSDINRVDQLSITVRWLDVKHENYAIRETFLGFVNVDDGTAKGLAETTCEFIKRIGLDFGKLCGQAYDGASVMSGAYNGVQAIIKSASKTPVPYIHCSAHNLNLVINDAVSSIVDNNNFFGVLQSIYVFFGSSINRSRDLQCLAKQDSLSLKKLCVTRWSSRIDAVRSIRDRYIDILKRLHSISLTSKERKERDEANALIKNMEKIEFIVCLVFWERLLGSVNSASKELQSENMDLSTAARLLSIALRELELLRASWDSVLMTANALADSWKICTEFGSSRKKTVKKFFDELASDERIEDPQKAFQVKIFYATIDKAIMQIKERFVGQKNVEEVFSFLFPYNLVKQNDAEIDLAAGKIVASYGEHFDEDLKREVRSFKNEFVKELKDKDVKTVSDALKILIKARIVSSFPQLFRLLILFLTIPVTVANAERSFSKLKLIKSYLRSSMSQDRLDGLAMLAIERDSITADIREKTVKDFSQQNARRRSRFHY